MPTKSPSRFVESSKISRRERKIKPEVSNTINEVLRDDDEKHRKMEIFQREFPMAFNKFVAENPTYAIQPAKRKPAHKKFQESVYTEDQTDLPCVLCSWGGNALQRSTVIKSTPETRNAAIYSDIWLALSSLFCLGTSSHYMPDDDYIVYTGSTDDDDDDSESEPKSAKIKNRKSRTKSFYTNPLEASISLVRGLGEPSKPKAKPKNLFAFSREGTYANNKELLGLDLMEESQRISKIFLGITREKGVTLNWALRAQKKGVTIHTCDVPNSPWLSMKSDTIIKQDKHTILNFMKDDSKSHEYDDTMEGYEFIEELGSGVQVRRYSYKAIWPTSARDFILCSSHCELEDGSLLMSTMSPPSGLYDDNSGFLRASINISGVLIRPIDPKLGGGCAITMVGHSDLKGSLPSSIINMLSVSLPLKVMTKIREVLEKK